MMLLLLRKGENHRIPDELDHRVARLAEQDACESGLGNPAVQKSFDGPRNDPTQRDKGLLEHELFISMVAARWLPMEENAYRISPGECHRNRNLFRFPAS